MLYMITKTGLKILSDFANNETVCKTYALHVAYQTFYNPVYKDKIIPFLKRDFLKMFIKEIASLYQFEIRDFHTSNKYQKWLENIKNSQKNLIRLDENIEYKLFNIISYTLTTPNIEEKNGLHTIIEPMKFDSISKLIIDHITHAGDPSIFPQLEKTLPAKQPKLAIQKTQQPEKNNCQEAIASQQSSLDLPEGRIDTVVIEALIKRKKPKQSHSGDTSFKDLEKEFEKYIASFGKPS